jgi:hypothetical protein
MGFVSFSEKGKKFYCTRLWRKARRRELAGNGDKKKMFLLSHQGIQMSKEVICMAEILSRKLNNWSGLRGGFMGADFRLQNLSLGILFAIWMESPQSHTSILSNLPAADFNIHMNWYFSSLFLKFYVFLYCSFLQVKQILPNRTKSYKQESLNRFGFRIHELLFLFFLYKKANFPNCNSIKISV